MKLLSPKNGNFLVVPSSVFAYGGRVWTAGESSNFWSSSLYSRSDNAAWRGTFNGVNCKVNYNGFGRYVGIGVRGVVGK